MVEKKQILKSASVITLVTIVSRILGYLRDQRIALLLGTGPLADSFWLAYRLPNMLRRLVGEGAMSAAFIPVFTGYVAKRSSAEVWEFANRLFWTLALLLAVMTVFGMIFSREVVLLFTALDRTPGHWEDAIGLNRLVFPYVFFIGLAALAMAILNCFHIFGPPAATPVLLNVAIIVFSFGALRRHFADPAQALAFGVLLGGAFQFLMLLPLLTKQGMRFEFGISFRHPGIRSVARLMAPAFLGYGVYQINVVVNTIFATAERMPEGTLTALQYGDRIMELVLGGYAIAVATAILPMMSHQAASLEYEKLKQTFAFSLRIVSFITIPAMVGLVVMREPIIRVLFQYGEFDAESTTLTARALLYYALGLPALAGVKLIVPGFYSSQDVRTPVRVAIYALILNCVVNVMCLHLFFPIFQNGGPALATSVAAYFNFFVLFVIFRQRYGRLGTLDILISIGKTTFCAAVMGAACHLALQLSPFERFQGALTHAVVLGFLILVATALFLGLAWLLRCPEVEEVWGITRRSRPASGAGAI
ncbi:MAG: murein biosynthesis integral membrane protein MurJ [Firmicutes bacterium]|nr:murein biosynthesis integral membrane protein MurJ [Bacillota bacterium]